MGASRGVSTTRVQQRRNECSECTPWKCVCDAGRASLTRASSSASLGAMRSRGVAPSGGSAAARTHSSTVTCSRSSAGYKEKLRQPRPRRSVQPTDETTTTTNDNKPKASARTAARRGLRRAESKRPAPLHATLTHKELAKTITRNSLLSSSCGGCWLVLLAAIVFARFFLR